MFYKLRSSLNKRRFNLQTSGILKTPPLPLEDAPWRIISLVSLSDLQMYILALKSFYLRLGAGRVTVLMDEPFPQSAVDLLSTHFPGIEFYKKEDVDTGVCQRGGTWERLVYLIERSRDEFVMQLDSDTITLGDISEIKNSIARNAAFCLNGYTGSVEGRKTIDGIGPMLNAAADARKSASNYIGVAFEQRMDSLEGSDHFNYVRGSSALAGFARGGVGRAIIDYFHGEGVRIMGPRWTEWGTEQSASNFAIANSPNSSVLPYPKYGNFDPSAMYSEAAFLHFFGTRRYLGNTYASIARKVISQLRHEIPRHEPFVPDL